MKFLMERCISMVTLGICTSLRKVISMFTEMESSWLTMLVLISSTPSAWPMACFTRVSMACTEMRTAPFSVFCTDTLPFSTEGSRRRARRIICTDHTSSTAAITASATMGHTPSPREIL